MNLLNLLKVVHSNSSSALVGLRWFSWIRSLGCSNSEKVQVSDGSDHDYFAVASV